MASNLRSVYRSIETLHSLSSAFLFTTGAEFADAQPSPADLIATSFMSSFIPYYKTIPAFYRFDFHDASPSRMFFAAWSCRRVFQTARTHAVTFPAIEIALSYEAPVP